MSGSAKVAPMPNRKTIERMTVTPEMATNMLDINQNNRPIRDGHVKRIARQIRDGKWRFNGDTIKIAKSKNVLDGQHRLWACIESNKPIDTVIVRGVEDDAFATIDTIRSMRSGRDVLSLHGVSRHGTIIAEGLKWLLRYNRGIIQNWRAPENRIENADVEAAYYQYKHFDQAADRAARIRQVATPSLMSFVFYVLSNRNFELGERMFDTLLSPARVRVTDPFFQLRRYFLNTEKRKDPVVSIALCFKAINAAKNGKSMDRLVWRREGKAAESFPELKV